MNSHLNNYRKPHCYCLTVTKNSKCPRVWSELTIGLPISFFLDIHHLLSCQLIFYVPLMNQKHVKQYIFVGCLSMPLLSRKSCDIVSLLLFDVALLSVIVVFWYSNTGRLLSVLWKLWGVKDNFLFLMRIFNWCFNITHDLFFSLFYFFM